MAKNIFGNKLSLLPLLLAAPMLIACGDDDDVQGVEPLPADCPIGFGGSILSEVEQSTRGSGLEEAGFKSFKVWANKALSDNVQPVINGYTVNWANNTAGSTETNTDGWDYIGIDDQTIKYWDFNASEYRFWAHAGSNVTANANGTSFEITGLTLSTTPPVTPLFTSIKKIERGSFGQTVVMEFLRPYAEVRVMFFCSQALDDAATISQIKFGPADGSITAKGSLTVSYSTTSDRESYSVKPVLGVEGTKDNLSFLNVTLTSANLSSATAVQAGVSSEPASSYYYVLPITATAKDFTMSAIVGEEPKTATVPAAYMQWQPNYRYTYIFKIDKVEQNLQFYDVQIDPWTYGGRQEETFTHW